MTGDPRSRRTAFTAVAAEYDLGRPDHPDAIYDALGPLDGLRIADVGAGTGIATRALLDRGARVVAIDPSTEMLARALARSPQLAAVAADGARLPVADGSLDLVTFGQSWHWLDPALRIHEVHRVLRTGARWAGWWTHARGAPWLDDTLWNLVEAACPGVRREQRDTDWGEDVRASGLFHIDERVTVTWSRSIPVAQAVVDHASHSYIAALPEPERAALLARIADLYRSEFPAGTAVIPQQTWLWIGHRHDRP